jgi:Raf kinase inhibitor-like YbhB/YbcL family protein
MDLRAATWVCALALACQSNQATDAGSRSPSATSPKIQEAEKTVGIVSSAFEHEKAIPTKHTCEGDDVSPPLSWSNIPAETKSLALIVDDPDAPDPAAPEMVWVHWVLYDVPPSTTELPEGVTVEQLPAGTRQGSNDWKRTGYGGPCPPIGRHRYFHKLYALDAKLGDLEEPTKADLETAMKGHVLAWGELVGTYEKSGK